ncbi:unnamed protein product [Penicillium bialowiezense]
MEPTSESIQSLGDWVLSRSERIAQDPNIGFIETLYHTCSSALVYLWRYRFRFAPQGPRKNTLRKDVADIRMWEENFPPGRLDDILRQSRHLKLNVVENLKGIGTILKHYLTGCDNFTTNGQHQRASGSGFAQELDTQLERAAIMLQFGDYDLSSDDDLSDDSSSTSEREQNCFGRIHCYVNCLIDIAPSIEHRVSLALRRVEPQNTHAENTMRLSPSAQPFVMRIQDRFLIELTPLVERLAQANWERSIRIRAQNKEESYTVDHDDVTLFNPYSIFDDSGLGTSVPAISQYAASATSHASFLSMPGIEAHGHLRVPSLPRSNGRPFQCKYCRKTISLRGRIEWKMHVFADLRSYLCTHAECEDAMKTFPSRKMWADHEFNEHFTQQQWRCFMCNTAITTESSFVEHLSLSHNIKLSGSRLAAAISEAQETGCSQEFKDHKCALCSEHGWQTRKAYVTHVGQHLEEISLASLPRDENDDSDSGSGSETPSIRSTRSLPLYSLGPAEGDSKANTPLRPPAYQSNLEDGNALNTEPPRAASPLVNTAIDDHMKRDDAESSNNSAASRILLELDDEIVSKYLERKNEQHFNGLTHQPHTLEGHELAQAGPSHSPVLVLSSGSYETYEHNDNYVSVPGPELRQHALSDYLLTASSAMSHIDNLQIPTAPQSDSGRTEVLVNQGMEKAKDLTQDHETSVLQGTPTPCTDMQNFDDEWEQMVQWDTDDDTIIN